jgi:MFS transporter, DHA2 family, multidrug resistance protein
LAPEASLPLPGLAVPFRLTPKIVLLTAALILATIMQALDGTIANVALPHMQGSLSSAQDQITWVLTSYVVTAAICTPLTAFLVNRYGRRRLTLVSIASFTIASMLCGAAQTLGQIVVFRILQGAAGSLLMPISQAIIMDVYPKEKHTSALAVWSMGVMMAPIFGPSIGGYLTEAYSWRWVFYVNLPVGVVSFIGIVIFLPESRRDRSVRFDLFGFGMMGTAIGALQLMLDRGTTLDWFSSTEILIEAVLAGMCGYFFLAHMFTARQPFLSRTLFKDTNYVAGLCVCFAVIVVVFGTNAILPTMLQSLLGYPVMTTGWLLMPRGLGNLIAGAFTGRFSAKIDPRLTILVGLGVLASALWQMSQFNLDVSGDTIMWNGLIQGFGMGLVFLPLTTVTFSTMEPRFRAEAASMYALIRNLGVSIGVSMNATLLARLIQVNHAELATHVTAFSHALHLSSPTPTSHGAAMLDLEVNRQAAMIAYASLYRLSAYLTIGTALLVPMMRLRKAQTSAAEQVVVEV